jgi:glycosyltransferase involved in cell wall biosynthesis
MKLIFDNIIFSLQHHGGVSVVWHELYKRFLNDSDFDIYFLKFDKYNSLGRILEDEMVKFTDNSLRNLPIRVQRYINPKINNNEKGIFHSSYYRTTSSVGISNITTLHDFNYEYYVTGLAKTVHSLQKMGAAVRSKKIICVSTNTKKDLLKFCPKISEHDVEVVYNGVSEIYKPLEVSCLELSALVPFGKNEYVLYVGDRKSEYKNFKMAVEACAISKVPLVIVGGGVLTMSEIELLDLLLGSQNYKSLTGISNSDLNLLYNCAAFFLYPTIYEGFGIPILEAQRTGCPVITSNYSSIPEIAGDGAFMISDINAQKISEIILQSKSREDCYKHIIDNGFSNSQKYSWDKCYQDTKKVYFEILA